MLLGALQLGDRCNKNGMYGKCATANSDCITYRCKCKDGFAKNGQECASTQPQPGIVTVLLDIFSLLTESSL